MWWMECWGSDVWGTPRRSCIPLENINRQNYKQCLQKMKSDRLVRETNSNFNVLAVELSLFCINSTFEMHCQSEKNPQHILRTTEFSFGLILVNIKQKLDIVWCNQTVFINSQRLSDTTELSQLWFRLWHIALTRTNHDSFHNWTDANIYISKKFYSNIQSFHSQKWKCCVQKNQVTLSNCISHLQGIHLVTHSHCMSWSRAYCGSEPARLCETETTKKCYYTRLGHFATAVFYKERERERDKVYRPFWGQRTSRSI